jgi:hypothetical protein
VYGSASTWTFNAVRLAHEAALPNGTVHTHFLQLAAAREMFAAPGAHIVKTHELTAPEAAELLLQQAGRIIVTVRDPRDAVTSLMRAHGQDFDMALSLVEKSMRLCARAAAHRRATLLHYESRFFEKRETILALASAADLSVTEAVADQIFLTLTRREVENQIARLPFRRDVLVNKERTDYLDPKTHWHTHHAGRQGKIGSFQDCLSASQAEMVLERLAGVYRVAA